VSKKFQSIQSVDFSKGDSFLKNYFSWLFFLIYLVIGGVVFFVLTFGDMGALATSHSSLTKAQEAHDSVAVKIEKKYKNNVIGILSHSAEKKMAGFMTYFEYMTDALRVEELWVNSIKIRLAPLKVLIKGETSSANNVQLFFQRLTEKGPFAKGKLRILAFSGERELTTKEKSKIEELKREGKRVEEQVALASTFAFEIGNYKQKKKKKRRMGLRS
jgi:hypothetical protein